MDTENPKPRGWSGYRRERKTVGETLYLKCNGAFHDDEWLPHYAFRWIPSRNIYQTHCIECNLYYQAKRKGSNGTVKLELVRKWLWEVINRCGSIHAAARTMGVSHTVLFRWLGRYKGYEYKRIKRDNVKIILATLRGLRDGSIQPAVAKKKGGRKFKYGCVGCGGPIEGETLGCVACRDRRYKRESREKAA